LSGAGWYGILRKPCGGRNGNGLHLIEKKVQVNLFYFL
jgi:hypothetical protein